MDQIANAKVYKKTSANSVLTLYMGSRDLIYSDGVVDPLRGVIAVDPKFLCSQKIFGQLTLTFRYGREDEEVMGLKFCNEVVIALKQIWPRMNYDGEMTILQQALVDRLGAGAHPFQIDVGSVAAPSVQLLPAKKYSGDPIGTSYDIRIFMTDLTDEKLQGKTAVKLGIRVLYKIPTNYQSYQQSTLSCTSTQKTSLRSRLSPKNCRLRKTKHQDEKSKSTNAINAESVTVDSEHLDDRLKSNVYNSEHEGPESFIEKPFLWTEGNISLKTSLDKCVYKHGESVSVKVQIRNSSRKVVRKIRIFAVQHVDVCMFSNGKFKNIVGEIVDSNHIKANDTFNSTYKIVPTIGSTKNWIAVESKYPYAHVTESPANNSYKLASSTFQDSTTKDRNVFAIYVTYYVKIKLTLSALGGDMSLKLPFILGYVGDGQYSQERPSDSDKLFVEIIPKDITPKRRNSRAKTDVSITETRLFTLGSPKSTITQERTTQSQSSHTTSIQVDIHREK